MGSGLAKIQLQYVTGAAALVDLDQRAALPGRGQGKQLAAGAERALFSLYIHIRAYWADKAVLDGQWKPPVVNRMQ
jgi:hypothetical protein